MKPIELQANATASANTHVTLRVKHNPAIHHLFAACRSVAAIGQVEQQHIENGDSFGSFWDEILQHSLVVATLTAAFLETHANDLFFDGALDEAIRVSQGICDSVEEMHRKSILCKYDAAMQAIMGQKLPRGEQWIQNVNALIELRNHVIHFKPEWNDVSGEHEELSKVQTINSINHRS